MDWFRFDQVIGGASTVGWIADVNGFIEGEIGSPGISMPGNTAFPFGWIDSRAVSMRNPSYVPGSSNTAHRPFYSLRNPGEINQIILHHTASSTFLTRMDIEAGWRSLGWWNGGYHEMIHADGRVEVCYEPSVVTNGAYGHNRTAYHIALIGNFRVGGAGPIPAQMTALTRRIQLCQQQFGIPLQRVFGHSERTATICPGLNMDLIRGRMPGGSGNAIPEFSAEQQRQSAIQQVVGLFGDLVGGAVDFVPTFSLGFYTKVPMKPGSPLQMKIKGIGDINTNEGYTVTLHNGKFSATTLDSTNIIRILEVIRDGVNQVIPETVSPVNIDRLQEVFKGFEQGWANFNLYIDGKGVPWIVLSVKGTFLNVTDNTKIDLAFKVMVTFSDAILTPIRKKILSGATALAKKVKGFLTPVAKAIVGLIALKVFKIILIGAAIGASILWIFNQVNELLRNDIGEELPAEDYLEYTQKFL